MKCDKCGERIGKYKIEVEVYRRFGFIFHWRTKLFLYHPTCYLESKKENLGIAEG
jgi:hypothetical protein